MWFRRYLFIGNSLRRFNKQKNMFLLKTTFCTQGSVKIIYNTDNANNRIRYLFKALVFFFNNSNLSTCVFAFMSYNDLRLLYYLYSTSSSGWLGELTLRIWKKSSLDFLDFILQQTYAHVVIDVPANRSQK